MFFQKHKKLLVLITALIFLLSTISAAAAAPTTIYGTYNGKTVKFSYADVLKAYIDNITEYITVWEAAQPKTSVTVNGKNISWADFVAAFANNEVSTVDEYASLPTAVEAPVPEKISPVSANGTVGEEIQNPDAPATVNVTVVIAINGKVTVTFSEDVTEVPAGLTVLKDGEAMDLAAEAFALVDGKVEVTVPVVEAGADEQSIVYSVKLGEAEAVAAEAMVIPAAGAVVTSITVAAISVEENKTATAAVIVKDQFDREMTDVELTYTSSDETVFTVDANGVVTGGTYVADVNTATLTVIYTPAEGAAVTGTATVTITEDTVAPTIDTVTVIDANHIVVTFTEKVAEAGAEQPTNYQITRISTAVGEDAALAILNADGKSVTLTLTTALVNSQNGYVLTIDQLHAIDIADLAGNAVNTGDEKIFSGVAGTDTTAPTLMSAAYDSATRELTLTFNENISDATFKASNITFAGVALTNDDQLGGAANDNIALITLSAATAANLNLSGTVTITLNAVDGNSLADAAGNEISATANVSLVTPPNIVAESCSFDETSRILTIKFDEAVTVEDITKIHLDDNGGADQTFDADNDTLVEGTDGTDTIKIQLSPATYALIHDQASATVGLVIEADAVADLNGTGNRAVAKTEITYTQDSVELAFSSATYNNRTNVLTIYFSEAVDNLNDTKFSIDTDPTTSAITLANATQVGDNGVAGVEDENSVVATLDDTDSATVEAWIAAGETVKIYTIANDAITDLAGNEIGTIALADGVTVTLVDEIAPTIANTEVSTLSAKKFAMTFNEQMDATTANTAANYVVYDLQNDKNISATEAELQADGVTVFVTLAENLTVPNLNNYKFIVNNVKDANGNRIANNSEKTFTLGSVDTTAPTVAAVTVTAVANRNNDTIVVNFTEAGSGLVESVVENPANYTFESPIGTAISLSGATFDLNTGTSVLTITLNGSELQFGDTYKLVINGIKDKADNAMDTYTKSDATVAGDNIAPTISSIAASTGETEDQILATFSEAVKESTAELAANYTILTDGAFGTTINDSDVSSITYTETDTNDDEVLDTFQATIKLAAGALDTQVRITSEAGIEDLAGNNMVAGANNDDITIVDGIAPTIESIVATTLEDAGNDTIVVTFSENVVAASVELEGNWVVKDASGNIINADSYQIAAGADTATITFDGAGDEVYNLVTGQSYTVEVDGVMDATGNVCVDSASDVAEGDATEPASFTVGDAAATADVVLTFNEDIDATTVQRTDYTVLYDVDGNFATTADQTTLVIATAVATAADEITLTLAADLPAAANEAADKIKVTLVENSGLKDLAGNAVTDELSAQATVQ